LTYGCLSWVAGAAQEVEDGLGDLARHRYALGRVELPRAEDTNRSPAWVAGSRVGFKATAAPARDSDARLVDIGVLAGTGDLLDPVGGRDQRRGVRLLAGGGAVINDDHNTVAGDFIVELCETGTRVATSAHAPHDDGQLKAGRNSGGEEDGLAREAIIGGVGLFVLVNLYVFNEFDSTREMMRVSQD